MNEEYKVYWDNTTGDNTNKTWENAIISNPSYTVAYNTAYNTDLENRVEKIEKLLKKIEQFLNKFFDTNINKE